MFNISQTAQKRTILLKSAGKNVFLVFLAGVVFNCTLAYGAIDPDRYITVDEIRPGAKAWCLTVLEGTKVEKFDLKVLSVVRDSQPGRDAILVVGLDERFKAIGPTKGCSGSPVYIDGRIAGALAASWSFAKDPLYLVTPIEDMLKVGAAQEQASASANGFTLPSKPSRAGATDFSMPIRLDAMSSYHTSGNTTPANGMNKQLPLAVSFPSHVCNELAGLFEPMGLVPVAGITAGTTEAGDFEPGGVLTVPLISGDISMAVTGTVTEVVDDKVYGFGHSFLGYGAVDLPMATGRIHTVVSNMLSSFKLGSPGPITGALRADEAEGIFGQIGAVAKTIPLKITVDRFNDTRQRSFNCQMAVNRFYTPMLLQSAVMGAGLMRGPLPSEHSVRYTAEIATRDHGTIRLDNVSSGNSLMEFGGEAVSVVSMLMNNSFEHAEITSFDFHMEIGPENLAAVIDRVELSHSVVKAGQTVDVSVLLRSWHASKTMQHVSLTVPGDLAPGKYRITIAGGSGYEKYQRKVAPYNYMAEDLDSLVEALKNILAVRRDRLYLTMTLPPGGITMRRNQLPHLPATKALLMQDAKRTTTATPYQHWIEKEVYSPYIISGEKTVEITVEE